MTTGPNSSSRSSRKPGSSVRITVGRTNQPSLSSTWPPATISAPAARASAIASCCVVNELSSMTAPMKFVKSATSPIFSSSTCAASRSRSSGQRFDGT